MVLALLIFALCDRILCFVFRYSLFVPAVKVWGCGTGCQDCHKFYIFDTIYQHQFEIFVTKCVEMEGKM